MSADKGSQALPDSRRFGVDVVVIADALNGQERSHLEALNLGRRWGLVSDPDTHAAFGNELIRRLSAIAAIEHIALAARPVADEATVAVIERAAERCDALIAVGSGTINDLCKLAAARLQRPYAVFATAPSMNGFVSANAALYVGGHKCSVVATTPRAAFFDLRVLANAPPRMIRSGLGDSVCRTTAQADWLLSHYLIGTTYSPEPFDMLAPFEAELLDGAEGLVHRDLAAMRALVSTLVVSGYGMTLVGTSEPASQGEHLISHTVEILHKGGGALHGEQVGVATLTMSELQHRWLDRSDPPQAPSTPTVDDIMAFFGPEVGARVAIEYAAKQQALSAARDTGRWAANWGAAVSHIAHIALPTARIRAALANAQCPMSPAELRWSPDLYTSVVRFARTIRNRVTFLDLGTVPK